jgi:hypothetical protein
MSSPSVVTPCIVTPFRCSHLDSNGEQTVTVFEIPVVFLKSFRRKEDFTFRNFTGWTAGLTKTNAPYHHFEYSTPNGTLFWWCETTSLLIIKDGVRFEIDISASNLRVSLRKKGYDIEEAIHDSVLLLLDKKYDEVGLFGTSGCIIAPLSLNYQKKVVPRPEHELVETNLARFFAMFC